MSYPIFSSVTGVGTSTPIAVDDMQAPFNIGISAAQTGTTTFNIEYSMQDPMAAGYTAGGATWFSMTGFAAITASAGGAFTTPCKAIRINLTAGTGTVTLTMVQAGPAY